MNLIEKALAQEKRSRQCEANGGHVFTKTRGPLTYGTGQVGYEHTCGRCGGIIIEFTGAVEHLKGKAKWTAASARLEGDE